MPHHAARVIIVVALVAIYQIVRESAAMARMFPERRGWRHFGLISLVIYVLELAIAVRLAVDVGTTEGVVFTILGLYAYALGSSWSLLGARTITKV